MVGCQCQCRLPSPRGVLNRDNNSFKFQASIVESPTVRVFPLSLPRSFSSTSESRCQTSTNTMPLPRSSRMLLLSPHILKRVFFTPHHRHPRGRRYYCIQNIDTAERQQTCRYDHPPAHRGGHRLQFRSSSPFSFPFYSRGVHALSQRPPAELRLLSALFGRSPALALS